MEGTNKRGIPRGSVPMGTIVIPEFGVPAIQVAKSLPLPLCILIDVEVPGLPRYSSTKGGSDGMPRLMGLPSKSALIRLLINLSSCTGAKLAYVSQLLKEIEQFRTSG
jgi:hypothetical protein